jgi:hypothetical protein
MVRLLLYDLQAWISPFVYAPSDTQRTEVTMDGDREMENPLPPVEWLAGWAVIFGSCLLFWLGVYSLAVE